MSSTIVLIRLILIKSPILIKFNVKRIKTAGTSCGKKIISHEKYNANSGAKGFIPKSTAIWAMIGGKQLIIADGVKTRLAIMPKNIVI